MSCFSRNENTRLLRLLSLKRIVSFSLLCTRFFMLPTSIVSSIASPFFMKNRRHSRSTTSSRFFLNSSCAGIEIRNKSRRCHC